jgi:hypothetical protein
MRWSRTKDKEIAKVIVSKLSEPDKTLREIQNETWLPKSTVAEIINKKIPEVRNSSETIAKMIDDNNKILNLTWWLLLDKLNAWESVRIDEIIKSRDLALKQNKLVEVIDNKEWEFIVKFEL